MVLWGAENVLSSAGSPRLLDMTPGSAGGLYPDPVWKTAGATIFDAPLLLGRTFSDVNVNLHITPVRKGGTSPESLDVVVYHGPFPGNRPPTLSITGTSWTPATNQPVTFAATALDPDGDTLAFFWEFDDPDAPASSGIRPFGIGTPNPDATLRSTASNTWATPGVYLVRCTVTDMKGGRATTSAAVTVGNGSGLAIGGVVKDAAGNPVAGAVVNNWGTGSPAVQFGASNFVASGETASNGLYLVHVQSNTTYRLMARHGGHSYTCSVGGSTTGTISVGSASVANVNFTRRTNTCTIGGGAYLEGIGGVYNPLLYGPLTVHDRISGQDAAVNTDGSWRMTVPEGPLDLTFVTQPGHPLRYGFLNPYEAMDDYTILSFFMDVPGAVASVGFAARAGTDPGTGGVVNIPVVLTLPNGYTNTTWSPRLWLRGEVDAASTAHYGVDYRMRSMEVLLGNGTSVFTNYLTLQLITNDAVYSRTVVLNLVPLSSASHLSAIPSHTHAIIPPNADLDDDGMPDGWEWQYSGTLTNLLPTADSDGDTVLNRDEYTADTDPGDSNSVLGVTAIQVLPAGVRIDWRGGSNAFQYLEYRQTLSDTGTTWQTIFTNSPVTTLTTNHLHQQDGVGTAWVYRVRASR